MKPQIIIILKFSQARFFFSAQTFECRADEVHDEVHKQEFSCLIEPFGLDHGFK